jgi:6-phosphogluconolactonase
MTNKTFSPTLFSLIILFSFSTCTPTENKNSTQNDTTIETNSNFLFIGTYTKKEGHVDGKAEGIYVYSLNPETGALIRESVAKEVINPSFLTLSSDGKFVYAVNETGEDVDTAGGEDVDTAGSISAFSFDIKTKTLQPLNTQSSHSFAPCHISVDQKNRFVFATNYVGGKVIVLPIKKDGGLLPASDIITLEGKSTHPRQESSHPHSIVLSPDDRFAYVSDLGTDKIMIYNIDYKNGKLLPNEIPFMTVEEGSGPRHFTFHPNGKFAYVINELNNSITTFEFNSKSGELTKIENITTLPTNFEGASQTADIHISPDGKYLYGSNRGHDSIVAFKIDPNSGKLTLIEHESTQGSFPRNFMISDNGKLLYVANQNSDNIVAFKIESDGALKAIDQIKVATPVCLKMM